MPTTTEHRDLTQRQTERLASLTRRIGEARDKAADLTDERLSFALELWNNGVPMPQIAEACGMHNWSLQRALVRKYGEEMLKRERWGQAPI